MLTNGNTLAGGDRNSDLLWRAPSDFADAIATAGLGHHTIVSDGDIHRFHVDGDRAGSKNGWYVFHVDNCPAGAFGSWKTNESHTWCAVSRERLTPEQDAGIRALLERAKAEREEEIATHRAGAARVAESRWKSSVPAAPTHSYLVTKCVRPHGTRQLGSFLQIPVFVDGRISSIQDIRPNGRKMFLKGGRISGGYFCIDDETRRPEILICEGFATGASLHEEIGAAVYCVFNCNNLLPVARYVRAQHPSAAISIAADNDAWTSGNPGVTKGRAAALAIGARLLVPDFTGMDVSGKPTDWNDWCALRRQAGGRQQ